MGERWVRAGCGALALAAALALPASGDEARHGGVRGQVIDAATGRPLPGARVVLEGTGFVAAADRTGAFRLERIPAGEHTLVVSYLGHQEERITVHVAAGRLFFHHVALHERGPDAETPAETSPARPIRESEARALNRQRTAPNVVSVVAPDQIGRFPDSNAAEAAQRVPGVSIERDQGEGRYVLVRSTPARFNATTINGDRLPSPESRTRATALDIIPAELLHGFEVAKTLTPDMDADSLGGAVNLTMKEAADEPSLFVSAAGGYNAAARTLDNGTLGFSASRRLDDGRLGLMLGAAAATADRASDNFEPVYDDGALSELDLRDYTLTRRHYGLAGALDYRLSAGSTLYLNGLYSYYSDDEDRRLVHYNLEDGEVDRELRDRLEVERLASVAAGGEHLLGGGFKLDYKLTWAYGSQRDPRKVETTFRQTDVAFAPNVSPESIDPDDIQANPLNDDPRAATLDEQRVGGLFAPERGLIAAVNLSRLLASGEGFTGFVKAGAKYRRNRERRSEEATVFSPDQTIPFGAFMDAGYDPGRFLDGRYRLGAAADPEAVLGLRDRFALEADDDHELAAECYEFREDVLAGYAMAGLYAGSRLFVLPGLRYEETRLDNSGYEVVWDEEGEHLSSRRTRAEARDRRLLPMLHLRYALTPDVNLRAAVTRSLVRPEYYDVVPYALVDRSEDSLVMGNPDLRPITSWNLDLVAERYLSSVGLVSAGVFRKSLSGYIHTATLSETLDGREWEVEQPRNGPPASLWGVELVYQNQLSFLPAPFDRLGLHANLTHTGSSTTLPGREGQDLTLPGQSKYLGNVALSYEKGGFSARGSLNFHSRFLTEFGEGPQEDVYADAHAQVDLSISQALTPRVRLFADVLNVTNEPLRLYEGSSDRPIQEEYYRYWASFGVKVRF